MPLRPFGTQVEGQSRRQVLAGRFAQLPELLTAGGTAYAAVDPDHLQTVLFEALRNG